MQSLFPSRSNIPLRMCSELWISSTIDSSYSFDCRVARSKSILTTRASQSRFMPISPTRRKPNAPTTQTNAIHANIVQKTARYPTMRAVGDALSVSREASVVAAAMTDIVVNPIDVPSCEQVLKIAPPRACVSGGKTAEMMRRPTVKRMSALKGERSCMVLH